MLVGLALVTLVLVVLFTIADRKTQVGLLTIYGTYLYTLWTVVV